MIRIPEWGHTVYLALNLFPDLVQLPMKICPHIWQIPGVSLPGGFFVLQVLVIGQHDSISWQPPFFTTCCPSHYTHGVLCNFKGPTMTDAKYILTRNLTSSSFFLVLDFPRVLVNLCNCFTTRPHRDNQHDVATS
jgi:hypothetical protein